MRFWLCLSMFGAVLSFITVIAGVNVHLNAIIGAIELACAVYFAALLKWGA